MLVPAEHKIEQENLFRAANADINNGIVATTREERIRLFGAWTRWLALKYPTVNPDLQGLPLQHQVALLVAYGRHVRHGGISTRKNKVQAGIVAMAL